MLGFVDDLDEEQSNRVGAAIDGVLDNADLGDLELGLQRNDACLHVAFQKPRGKKVPPGDIRPLVRDLLAAVQRAEVPLAEVSLCRMQAAARDSHFDHAVDDPRDEEEASEPEGGLFMAFPTVDDQRVPERRNMRLWLSGLRIVYGLPEVELGEPGPRDREVAAALAAGLEHAFRGLPPPFRDRDGADGRVNALIGPGGRGGFGVVVEGMNERMLVHYPSSSRFREYELMQAVRDATAAAGLAPEVHWYREGGTYLLNLWER
jgi:hypothetical protein